MTRTKNTRVAVPVILFAVLLHFSCGSQLTENEGSWESMRAGGGGDDSTTRLSEFAEGSEGWRALASLPRPAWDQGKVKLDLDPSATPSYWVAPNDLVSQVLSHFRESADSESGVSIRLGVITPPECDVDGISCGLRVAVLGESCALEHEVPVQSGGPQILNLTMQGGVEQDLPGAGIMEEGWLFCSELMHPDRVCAEPNAMSAMGAALSSLRFIIIAVDVQFLGPASPGQLTFEVETFELLRQSQIETSEPEILLDVSGHSGWLVLQDFASVGRCNVQRLPECPWDACRSQLQEALESSCQGPFGQTPTSHCWKQPLPLRYRMELISFRLPDETVLSSCYAAQSCIGAMPISVSNISHTIEADLTGWGTFYWTPPVDWFLDHRYSRGLEAPNNILGQVLQVELSTEHYEGHIQEFPDENNDVIVIGGNGQILTYTLQTAVGRELRVHTIPFTSDAGWLQNDNPAGTQTVKGVFRNVKWLLVRGAFHRLESNGKAVSTRLGAAALLSSVSNVEGNFPSAGPLSGGTVVTVMGQGFSEHADGRLCMWRCSSKPGAFSVAPQQFINSTHLSCRAPWLGESDHCKFFLAKTIGGKHYITAVMTDYLFYAPPFISSLEPSEGPMGTATTLTLHGRGFRDISTATCGFLLHCGSLQISMASSAVVKRESLDSEEDGIIECQVPPGQCAGSVSVLLALNGLDYTTTTNECPSWTTQPPTGCSFQYLDPSGHPGHNSEAINPINHAGICCAMESQDDCWDCCNEFPGLNDCGECCSKVKAKGGLQKVLVVLFISYFFYAAVGGLVANLFVRRRQIREDTGSDQPYSMAEAYFLCVFFGPLGAHRFYCGQKGNVVYFYALTFGLFSMLWLIDLWHTKHLVEKCNKLRSLAQETEEGINVVDDVELSNGISGRIGKSGTLSAPLISEGVDDEQETTASGGRDMLGQGSQRAKEMVQQAGSMASKAAAGLQRGLGVGGSLNRRSRLEDDLEMTDLHEPRERGDG